MAVNGKEIEVKFYIPNLQAIESKLKTLGAWLDQPRIYEINLRFDTRNGDLCRQYRVLRLRQDTRTRLTYKGPGIIEDGARAREELELTVSDFDTAKALLEALGYEVVVMYEKYRTTYTFEGLIITLDEMPYGNFIEIEGPNGNSIRDTAHLLDLDWEERINESYLVLFERIRTAMGLTFRDLSFDNFRGVSVSPLLFRILAKGSVP